MSLIFLSKRCVLNFGWRKRGCRESWTAEQLSGPALPDRIVDRNDKYRAVMPFHIGGHKPRVSPRRGYPLKNRLQVAGAGLLFLFAGVYRMVNGVYSWTNWQGQRVDVELLIAAGALTITFAVIPAS